MENGLFPLLANAASALLGGWVGSYLALRKHRREKAFERQLEWHESTAELLERIATELHSIGTKSTHGELAAADLARLHGEFAQLIALAPKGKLYATRYSSRKFTGLLPALLQADMKHIPAGTSREEVEKRLAAQASALAALERPIRAVASALAEDARKQLGLRPIELTAREKLLQRLRSMFVRRKP